MALSCTTSAAIPRGSAGSFYFECYGNYAGGSGEGTTTQIEHSTDLSSWTTTVLGVDYSTDDSWGGNTSGVGADTNFYVRGSVTDPVSLPHYATGNIIGAKSNANAASSQTPTSSAIASSTATISCDYTPNVNASSCSAQLQYKKTTDPGWTNAGSAQTTGGSSQIPISRDITGLSALTQYQVRLVITRTTNNDTSLTSATASFTTLAGTPAVTTDAASNVAATTAKLNGTLDINDGTGVNVYFKWGTDNPPTQNTTANQSMSADGAFEQAISGLSANTTYYAQAYASFSTPSGSPVSGSVVSFLTPADPAAEAANEDHMQVFEFNERKYGVESTFYFAVASPAATSSDRFFNAASPFVAGDVQISKDGGAFANVTSLPTRVGSTAIFSLTLSATEMQATTIVVQIVDQNGPAFRDAVIVVRTKLQVGQIDADASQLTNTSGFIATGVGTGHGISAIGGATGKDIDGIIGEHFQRVSVAQAGGAATVTLDASASGTNDYYNGSIIMVVDGTGAGQARVITDYDGSTKVATVDSSWSTNPASGSKCLIAGGARPWDLAPAAELSAIPASTGTWAQKLQFIFQRFAFKITQTATVQTLFKADSSTSLGTRSASDDGTTQTLGKIS